MQPIQSVLFHVNIILNKVSKKENLFLSNAASVRLKTGGCQGKRKKEGKRNPDQGFWMRGRGGLSNSSLLPGCSSTAAAAPASRRRSPFPRPSSTAGGGEACAGSAPCRKAARGTHPASRPCPRLTFKCQTPPADGGMRAGLGWAGGAAPRDPLPAAHLRSPRDSPRPAGAARGAEIKYLTLL